MRKTQLKCSANSDTWLTGHLEHHPYQWAENSSFQRNILNDKSGPQIKFKWFQTWYFPFTNLLTINSSSQFYCQLLIINIIHLAIPANWKIFKSKRNLSQLFSAKSIHDSTARICWQKHFHGDELQHQCCGLASSLNKSGWKLRLLMNEIASV